MDYNFFHKKSANSGVANLQTNLLDINNQQNIYINQLLETLKKTIYSGFKNNIWGADLAYMQLINKVNKGIRFLLFVIDIFSKYP